MKTPPPADNWQSGDPYERYIGRWSRLVAPPFVRWLDVPAGKRWLDVGCGTGALCGAIVDHAAPAAVTGIDPSDGFLAVARARLPGGVAFHVGSATAIPLPDAAVDVVVSGLVLNFIPDPAAALREMARVAGRDARIGLYVWDYAGKMELLRTFWDAVAAVDPAAASLDEGERFPLCDPDALAATAAVAGLRAVDVTAIDVPTIFADFADLWEPFLGGQGPAPSYLLALDEPTRTAVRETLRARLPRQDDGSIHLVARAWALRSRA
ncbi:MAG: class I SAM-dependent methyltransferase [Caldilineaceae bacterium]|nr:class I SAM-dependent methyltransferase [Caldilineaceae bacterium]